MSDTTTLEMICAGCGEEAANCYMWVEVSGKTYCCDICAKRHVPPPPSTPEPRITAADEMAKAVTEAVDAYDSGDEHNWKGLVHALRAAIAAYNATRPLAGQEDARG